MIGQTTIGWTDGRRDGWSDTQTTTRWTDGRRDSWSDNHWMDRWKEGWLVRQPLDGQMEGGMVGQVTTSVAYRYRKSTSIIELFVSIISIYIGFLATIF